MKTEEEVRVFLKDKSFSSEDTRTIIAIIKAKNYNGINVVIGAIPNSKLIDFIDWFESESKENNQDTIIFEGKEYGFVEYNIIGHIHCNLCDLRLRDRKGSCPYPCMDTERYDKREGYFRLKEQELKLIPNEFYYFSSENAEFIIQFKKIGNYPTGSYNYFYLLNVGDKALFIDEWCSIFDMRFATPEEKQQLINAVEKQEHKLFNEETKTFEDKPNNILVPENIKIFLVDFDEYILGLPLNKDKQLIYYEPDYKGWQTLSSSNCEILKCKLIKTIFTDLRIGDIYFDGDIDIHRCWLSFYNIKITIDRGIYIEEDEDNNFSIINDKPNRQIVYKVIPID